MMLSSGGYSNDFARCERLRIASRLLKPVKKSELYDAIRIAMGVKTKDEPPIRHVADAAEPVRTLKILLAEDSLVNQKLVAALSGKTGALNCAGQQWTGGGRARSRRKSSTWC